MRNLVDTYGMILIIIVVEIWNIIDDCTEKIKNYIDWRSDDDE